MSFDQLLLAGVALGLVLVGLYVVVARRDRARAALADPPIASRSVDSEPVETAPRETETAPRETETAPRETETAPRETETAPREMEPSPIDTVHSTEDAVARLAETVSALRRLAELKDEEIEHDTAVRSEVQTGWRPVSNDHVPPPRPDNSPTPGDWGPPTLSDRETPTPGPAPLPPMVTEVSQVRLDPNTKMHPDSASQLRLSVGRAFSPAAPVARRDLFAGRVDQLETLVDVVFERGQHAVVYGERGVGKTSLASILALVFTEEQNKLPLRVNCDASDDYDSVWRKVIEELEVAIEASDRELPNSRAGIERALAKNELGPNDVARLLKQLGPELECVIFIDEFDTIADDQAPRQFADTVKMLSDQLVPSTLIILGVADTLDELLAEHGSVHRALVHVHMPRMSVPELTEIVRRGLELLTMDIEAQAADLIAYLSQGFPHFTHLLAQAAARAAIQAHRPLVTVQDVNDATARVSGRIEMWIQDAYEKATASAHDSIYPQVLLASALARNDDRGYFAPADVREPMTGIMGKSYEIPSFIRQLNALADPERGPVLVRTGAERKHRYRFVEPQMEPYVIMRSMGEGLLTTEGLHALIGTGEMTTT